MKTFIKRSWLFLLVLIFSIVTFLYLQPFFLNYAISNLNGAVYKVSCIPPGGNIVSDKISSQNPEQETSSNTPISVGFVQPLVDSFLGKNIKREWINQSWFKYGFFLKNTINVAYWRVKVSDPPKTDVVLVNAFAKFSNERVYSLPYNGSVNLDFLVATTFDKIGQDEVLKTLKLDKGGLEPADKESVRMVVGPKGIFSVETLDNQHNPIILGTNYKSDDGEVCEFLILAKPVAFTWFVSVIFLVLISMFIFSIVPLIFKRIYILSDAKKYFKGKS